jgi:transposase
MDRIAVFVGLDYHQSSIQVCVVDGAGQVLVNRRCGNSAWEIIDRVRGCGRVIGVAIESCSGAANLADELISLTRWSVHLAHSGYVARIKQSPDKSDTSDAHLLADLVRVGYLPRVWLAPEAVRELRRLVRYRQQLVAERRNLKLRIRALLRDQRVGPAPAGAWTRRWWHWVEHEVSVSPQSRWIVQCERGRLKAVFEQIVVVEDRLASLTAEDVLVARLLAQAGIGPVTSWTLRAEIGRFDRFGTGKQLARFCGLSPRNASSGTRMADAGLIQAGNRALRATLIEVAHRLIRQSGYWQVWAGARLAAGKPKCVVVAAVANRWVRWLYHQMQPEVLAA